MQKRILLWIFPVLLTIEALYSCELLGIGAPVVSMGTFLTINGQGHVTKNVTYTYGNSTYTYNSEGTYEAVLFDFEDSGEDWNDNDAALCG